MAHFELIWEGGEENGSGFKISVNNKKKFPKKNFQKFFFLTLPISLISLSKVRYCIIYHSLSHI